jgi:calcineurin-like phosphoesterase family protein
MIHEKFFIGDTHFFHGNTWLKFKRDDGTPLRPFSSTHEMNEYMIDKWNSVVKEQDYVYHMGDVTFRYDGAFVALMQRLKGRKRLILGNHDRIKGTKLLDFFEKLDLWKGFKEFDFTCSHIPLKLDSLRDGHFNVHGHVHQNSLSDPHYINVSVEVRDYTPVHLDTILEEIKKVK